MADRAPELPDTRPSSPKPEAALPVPGERTPFGKEPQDPERPDRFRTFIAAGVALAVIAAIVTVIAIATRPRPKAGGTIDDAFAVALPGGGVLATVQVSVRNLSGKPLWIRDIQAQLTAPDGSQYNDTAASAGDFDRYFQAYPDLRTHSIQALPVEARINPGQQLWGSVVVSFPVTLDTFNGRRAIAVMIYPYASATVPNGGNEPPAVITRAGP